MITVILWLNQDIEKLSPIAEKKYAHPHCYINMHCSGSFPTIKK